MDEYYHNIELESFSLNNDLINSLSLNPLNDDIFIYHDTNEDSEGNLTTSIILYNLSDKKEINRKIIENDISSLKYSNDGKYIGYLVSPIVYIVDSTTLDLKYS